MAHTSRRALSYRPSHPIICATIPDDVARAQPRPQKCATQKNPHSSGNDGSFYLDEKRRDAAALRRHADERARRERPCGAARRAPIAPSQLTRRVPRGDVDVGAAATKAVVGAVRSVRVGGVVADEANVVDVIPKGDVELNEHALELPDLCRDGVS